MDQDSLVTDAIDAGAAFLAEFEKKFPVAAAFWLKAREDTPWYLYVASDQFAGENRTKAYEEMHRINQEMRDIHLDFKVKLIETDDPMAQTAIGLHKLYTIKKPTRLRDRHFGRIFPDEVWLYPNPIAVS
jgi:hypothetical protein